MKATVCVDALTTSAAVVNPDELATMKGGRSIVRTDAPSVETDRKAIRWFRYFSLGPVDIAVAGDAGGIKYYTDRAQPEPWSLVRAAVTLSGPIVAAALGLPAW